MHLDPASADAILSQITCVVSESSAPSAPYMCLLSHYKWYMQVGMPEVDDVVGATLNYKLRVARGNVRQFLTSATEGVLLGQYGDVVTKILAAVDEIEAKTGKPLDAANKQGWKTLSSKVEVRSLSIRICS